MSITTEQAVERGLAMVNELLAMKSSQDGVPRSPIGVIGPKEGYDKFWQDAQDVATFVMAAGLAVPLMDRLADAGRSMERQGLITVNHGDSYAETALDYLLKNVHPN